MNIENKCHPKTWLLSFWFQDENDSDGISDEDEGFEDLEQDEEENAVALNRVLGLMSAAN